MRFYRRRWRYHIDDTTDDGRFMKDVKRGSNIRTMCCRIASPLSGDEPIVITLIRYIDFSNALGLELKRLCVDEMQDLNERPLLSEYNMCLSFGCFSKQRA